MLVRADHAWADAARWLFYRRYRCDDNGRYPDICLIVPVQLGDEVFEVDVLLDVVVEDELLRVPLPTRVRSILIQPEMSNILKLPHCPG